MTLRFSFTGISEIKKRLWSMFYILSGKSFIQIVNQGNGIRVISLIDTPKEQAVYMLLGIEQFAGEMKKSLPPNLYKAIKEDQNAQQ